MDYVDDTMVLPHNSPAFIPSSSSGSIISQSQPRRPADLLQFYESPSNIASSSGSNQQQQVEQPQQPIPAPVEPPKPIFHGASISPERVPMIFHVWLQSLWLAPSEYVNPMSTVICFAADRTLSKHNRSACYLELVSAMWNTP